MWGRYRAKNLINLIFFRIVSVIVSVIVSIIVCVAIVVVISPVISICVSIWRRRYAIVFIRIQVNEIKRTKENG